MLDIFEECLDTYDASVVSRGDPGVLRSKDGNDPTKAEIDTSSHKSRSDSQAANLHQKPILIPRIHPAHDPSTISENLTDETQTQGDCESCGLAGEGIDAHEAEEGEAEEDDESDVSGEAHFVVVV